jgi:hypothetical protein
MVTLRNDCRTDTPGSTKKIARAPSGNQSAFLNSATVAESSPAPADARRFPRYLNNTPRGILPATEHLIPLNFSPVATPRLSQRRIMSQSDRRVELPHDLKKSPTRLTRTSVLTIMFYTEGIVPHCVPLSPFFCRWNNLPWLPVVTRLYYSLSSASPSPQVFSAVSMVRLGTVWAIRWHARGGRPQIHSSRVTAASSKIHCRLWGARRTRSWHTRQTQANPAEGCTQSRSVGSAV